MQNGMRLSHAFASLRRWIPWHDWKTSEMLEVSIIIVINIYDGTVSIIARKCGTNWWYPCEASGVRMVHTALLWAR